VLEDTNKFESKKWALGKPSEKKEKVIFPSLRILSKVANSALAEATFCVTFCETTIGTDNLSYIYTIHSSSSPHS
jgi:hypothetical protein